MIGILLINLGTPDAPTVNAVRRYLREFLTDPRVVNLSFLPRWLLVNVIIAPFRAYSSAKLYKSIWQAAGSPLLLNSQKLQNKISQQLGGGYVVELGMRYGAPSIKQALKNLMQHNCRKIIVLPLFPQYSNAATGSAIAKTLFELQQYWHIPEIKVYKDFYDRPEYIYSLSNSTKKSLHKIKFDHLLFSYHGLPANADGAEYYRVQCYATTRLVAAELGLAAKQYGTAFQSRLGRLPWITPYMELVLEELAKSGVKNLAVVCPSFVADCLETIEEIGIKARNRWQELGGDNFHLVPCLNDTATWVNNITKLFLQS